MARTKNYKAKASGTATDLAAGLGATDALVELPPNPRHQNLIDLRPWLGRGIDDWISAVTTVLKARLHSGNYSVATIASFASNGIKVFLPYLTGSHVDTDIDNLSRNQDIAVGLQVILKPRARPTPTWTSMPERTLDFEF